MVFFGHNIKLKFHDYNGKQFYLNLNINACIFNLDEYINDMWLDFWLEIISNNKTKCKMYK